MSQSAGRRANYRRPDRYADVASSSDSSSVAADDAAVDASIQKASRTNSRPVIKPAAVSGNKRPRQLSGITQPTAVPASNDSESSADSEADDSSGTSQSDDESGPTKKPRSEANDGKVAGAQPMHASMLISVHRALNCSYRLFRDHKVPLPPVAALNQRPALSTINQLSDGKNNMQIPGT
jgi:hypothetical protein